MKTKNIAFLVLLGLVLGTVGLPADDNISQTEFDPLVLPEAMDSSLLGSYNFGLYLGTENIGQMLFSVDEAGDEEAAYFVRVIARMAVGPRHFYAEESSYLDSAFSMLYSDKYDEETNDDGTISTTIEQLELTGGNWRLLRTQDDEMKDYILPASGGNYPGVSNMLLLAKKLPLAEPGRYRVGYVHWPETVTEDRRPEYRTLTMYVGGQRMPFDFRGTNKMVHEVRMEQEDGENYIFLIDDSGTILSIGSDEMPIRFLAGSDSEITANLPSSKPDTVGSDDPLSAVAVYFEVIAQARGPEDLDLVLDWEAVHAEMSLENDAVAQMSTDTIASLFKSQFAGGEAPVSMDEIEMLLAMVETKVFGDTATVVLPGKGDAFRLRRTETGWLITHFPH